MSILKPGITVCIPTIPPRRDMHKRALDSVIAAAANVYPGVPVLCRTEVDAGREGAAITRQRALSKVDTTWVAFLDDDDTMDPWHLKELYDAAHTYKADYLWSQFRIGLADGRTRPGPSPLGAGTFQQWNDEQPAQTTVTTMVRTSLAWEAGCGFLNEHADGEEGSRIDGQRAGEDWLFTLACRAAGGVFRHVPKVTWTWNHHASNTSGLPHRW